jgi:hypothetical protein
MIEHFEEEVKKYSDRHQGESVLFILKIDSYITACINKNDIYTKILVVDLTLET